MRCITRTPARYCTGTFKPSNILVTDSGQVRLLDFGVAKLLDQEEEHTELTQVYAGAHPRICQSELLRGERVDAASDIYALGVVLYELWQAAVRTG